MENKQIKNREYWIDAVRSFACLCVITTHAPIPNNSSDQFVIAITNYFSVAGASILFFMISGALILYREQPVIPFMKKRVSRIFFPMVIWSIISLLVAYSYGDIPISELGGKVLMIPFYPQVGTYWFIYVIFGIYLITPILSVWLNKCKKKDIEIYLGIWGITLLLPYILLMDKDFNSIVGLTSGYLYSFYGFLGFAVLGFYLRRYVNIKKVTPIHILALIIAVSLPAFLYMIKIIPHDVIQNRMSINIVFLSVCYFVVIKHIKFSKKYCSLFYNFAQHSFGIYLVHYLVMKRIIWPILEVYQMSYFIQIPLVVFSTAFISYLIVHLVSKLPYSKYIVGL